MSTSAEPTAAEELEDQLRHALAAGNEHALRELLTEWHPAEIARLVESESGDTRDTLWDSLPSERQSEVLVELSDSVRGQFIDRMGAGELLSVTEHLDPDDAADLLGELPEERVFQILNALDQQERQRLESILSYPEDTAGGLMTTEAVTVRPDITLDVVLRYLRQRGELPETTDTLVVVDRGGHYLGLLPLTALLTQKPDTRVGQIMDRETRPIAVDLADAEVATLFAQRDLVSAPVVDESGQFVGRITIDDVVDVMREDAEQSFMNMAGMSAEDDLFAPVLRSARRRGLWLGVNLATAFLASWVIGLFDAALERMVALAILMPIVASMGGNAGSQTLALIIRGIALEQISPRNAWRLLNRELIVGSVNSAVWALVVGAISVAWFRDLRLGLVIGAAMIINLLVAAAAGFLIPITLRRVGIDPAIASAVFLTTVTDVVGFLAFLGLASWVLL